MTIFPAIPLAFLSGMLVAMLTENATHNSRRLPGGSIGMGACTVFLISSYAPIDVIVLSVVGLAGWFVYCFLILKK
jgi:hypothetical protein